MTAHSAIVLLSVLCGVSLGGWIRAEIVAMQERRRAEAVAAAAARDAERIRVAAVEAAEAEAAWAWYCNGPLGGPRSAPLGYERVAGRFLRLRQTLETARADVAQH